MSRPLPAPCLAAALSGLAALLATACGTPPPAPPPLQLLRSHRAGHALGEAPQALPAVGAAPGDGAPAGGSAAPDDDPSAAAALSIEWFWLPSGSGDGLTPVGVHALAISGSGGDDPFAAAPLILGSARVALGDEAAEVAQRLRALPGDDASRLGVQAEALPVGVTTTLTPGPVALELCRPGAAGGIELALVREGQVPLGAVRQASAPDDAGAAAPGDEEDEGDDDERPPESPAEAARRAAGAAPVEWRELVLLDTPLQVGGPPAVVALPGRTPGMALVALIEARAAPVESAARAQHAARLAECLADVAQSHREQSARAQAIDAAESKRRQLLTAARAMSQAGDRLRAAVFLSSECGASFTLDTVLVADPAALEELAAAWRAVVGTDIEPLVAGDRLAWSLERTTALWLAQRAEAGTLSAELEAVMLRQAGVAARSPGLLQQLAEESEGLQAWELRLEQENRLALEDNQPGSRVRGFDWLAARGRAPPGFDPLGSRPERQAALLAADESP